MNCNECAVKRNKDIPYIAYEAECARHERKVKQIIISYTLVVVLLIAAFVGYVIYDRYVDSQYEWVDESVELSTRGGGNANYIGNDGDIYNGLYTSAPENP